MVDSPHRTFATDLPISQKRMESYVDGPLAQFMGGGEFHFTEGSANEILRLLDMHSGIDAIQVEPGRNGRIRLIASRVQQVGPYRSFTIRESRPSGAMTEWDKLRRAFEEPDREFARPAITIQAYTDSTERLLLAGMMMTRDLYGYIMAVGWDSLGQRTNHDRTTFRVVWWNDILRRGYKLKIYEAPPAGQSSFGFE